ncbi:MAG: UDP-2,3-diacylglucosamine diphosphatase [Bacteroidales bacterium]|nr:UDP-2,3-diacylglucosamine diphosphatase [Bacteroidales bacterium]
MPLEKNKVYFISDFHLGIPDHDSSLEREKLLVQWLDMAWKDAAEIFLMGDIFDFWFEYKTVVPKGYVRFLGKLAEIADSGVPVHVFRGNHDLWAFNYLEKEIGVKLYRKPIIREMYGKVFYLAHGDGLGPGDRSYKFLKKVFEFRPNQFLFSWLHPDLGAAMGNYFSRRSRLAKINYAAVQEQYFEREKEILFHYARKKASELPNVDFFVFGHRHIPLQEPVTDKANLIILGDWISHFSYGVFENGVFEVRTFDI